MDLAADVDAMFSTAPLGGSASKDAWVVWDSLAAGPIDKYSYMGEIQYREPMVISKK